MNEFELIARIAPKLPLNDQVVRGAGDDCALLDFGLKDQFVLFKTDAVVEGIHFTAETPARKVGRTDAADRVADVCVALLPKR